MKDNFGIIVRFLFLLMAASVFMPIILLILILAMINYILLCIVQKESIITAFKMWSIRLKQGIMMNIDFILNGF